MDYRRTDSKNQCTEKNAQPQLQALVHFMHQLNLAQYTQNLLALGFDDLDYLSGLEKMVLQNVASQAKMLPGHACKFADAVVTKTKIPGADSGAPKSTKKSKLVEKTTKGLEIDDSYVVCIVDCSASMVTIGREVKDGFNTFIKEQCALPGKCLATVVKFNHKVKVVQHGVDIRKLPEADSSTFKPAGTTALHDAICVTIKLVKSKIARLVRKPTRVIFMLLTDGEENSSRKYTKKNVMQFIQQCEELSWTFNFIGANQNAVETGTKIGFQPESCLSYTADGDHAAQAWNNMSANCIRQRNGGSSAWKDEERMSSVSDDFFLTGDINASISW